MASLINLVKSDPDLIIASMAFATAVIALIGLISSIVTIIIQHNHNRKSIMPLICIRFGNDKHGPYVELKNQGIGPAILKNIEVRKVDDADIIIYKSIRQLLLKERLGESDIASIQSPNCIKDTGNLAISPGESIVLFAMNDSRGALVEDEKKSARGALNNLIIVVSYKDFYGKIYRFSECIFPN